MKDVLPISDRGTENWGANDVEKNWEKIEEYMVRAEKIVDSPNSWCVSEFRGSEG